MRRGLLAVAAAGALVAGCAQVPDSGPVKVGRQLSGGSGSDDTIPLPPLFAAAGPLPGASPAVLVRGFLAAMLDSQDNYGVGRSYLNSGTDWNSGQGTTTYEAPTLRVTSSGSTVTVRAHRVGEISRRGTFTVDPGVLVRRFSVVRGDGGWRISRLVGGVLLSTDDALRTLQVANLYYLNGAQDRLVPDPILVSPQQPGIATRLIEALMAGPSPSLAPAVHSAVPPGVNLIGNVPINQNGVAEVDLSSGVGQISSVLLARLSAQVVWTLKQLASVTSVQMLVNGSPLTAPNVAALQPIDAWQQFDPSVVPTAPGALLVRAGEPVSLEGTVPTPLSNSGLSAPTRSADGTVVAGLREAAGRTSLVVGPADGPLTVRTSAPIVSAPAFDPEGDVLVAEGGPDGQQIVEYPIHGPREVVSSSAPLDGTIEAISLSPDGSRIAAVVGPAGHGELVVGAISSLTARPGGHPTHPVVSGVHVLMPGGQDVQDVAWASADQLVCTVGGSRSRRGVVEISVDGYQQTSLGAVGLTPAPRQVAAAPGRRILASGAGGVWALSGGQWARVATGSDPSYPG